MEARFVHRAHTRLVTFVRSLLVLGAVALICAQVAVAADCNLCHTSGGVAMDPSAHPVPPFSTVSGWDPRDGQCTICHEVPQDILPTYQNPPYGAYPADLGADLDHEWIIDTNCDVCHYGVHGVVKSGPYYSMPDGATIDLSGSDCSGCHSSGMSAGEAYPAGAVPQVNSGVHGDTTASHLPVVDSGCAECHGSSLTAVHPDCSSCHTPTAPAGATCSSCHPDYVNPHGAGVRTWGEMDYYTWGSTGRDGGVLNTLGANPSNPGVHGNYLANTAKCGICHSVHRAKANGVKLLNSATTTCIGCHAVGTTATAVTVNVGNGPHSVSTTCNTRGCHVDNPHGANGSQYRIVAAKLLSKAADDWLTSKALSNPAASGITADKLNVVDTSWDEGTKSAVRTGYTCNIQGCHYQTLLAVVNKGWSEDRKGPRYDLTDHRNVTGHMSVAAANNTEASYVPVSSCVSCHDQTDSLTGNGTSTVSGFTFPHGQTPSAGSTNNTSNTRAYLWYTTAGDAMGADSGFFAAPNDKAFDGACLKCHRDGAGNGIGLPASLPGDTVAPTTTSNAAGPYSGSATVLLTPTDNSGGSGVAHTYYTINGGATQSGTTVSITTPGTYTIQFWSVDVAGNAESPKTASVVVNPVSATGTIHFDWNSTPGSYAYFEVRDASWQLVDSGWGYEWDGWDGHFYVTVPTSSQPYYARIFWSDPGYDDGEEYWTPALGDPRGPVNRPSTTEYYLPITIDQPGEQYDMWY